MAELEQAVKLNPQQPVFLNQLGIAYRQQGQFAKARERYGRRLSAALEPVEQQRHAGKGAGDGSNFVVRLRRFHKEYVRPRFAVGARAAERGVHSLDGAGIGACDDQKFGRAAGLGRGADFFDHLRSGHYAFAFHVAAALRRHLVFNVDCGDARALVIGHGADHVQGIAVAGIRVGNHGQFHSLHDARGIVHHFGLGQQARVRPPQKRRRRAEAGHIHGGESGFFYEARGERVVSARSQNGLRAGQQ
jgi:hypothetical protein